MRNWLLGSAFVVTWSSGFVGAALAGPTMAPAPLLAWRYLLATAVLLAACLLVPVPHERGVLSARSLLQQLVLGILAHVVFLGGVFGAAAAGLDAGVSALVCALQPLAVAAAGFVAFRDRLGARQWLGLLVGIGGVALSVGTTGGSAAAGVWLVVGSLLGLSASSLLERAWAPRVPLLWSLTLQTAVGAACFTVWALATTGMPLSTSPSFALALAWLVLFSGLGGYASFTACLRRLGPTATSTLLYLTPAVTAVWAWGMFGQALSGPQLAGIAVVSAGVGLTLVKPRRGGGSAPHSLGRENRRPGTLRS